MEFIPIRIPVETNPLNLKENLRQDLLYQRHERVWTIPIPPVQLHSDNIHQNHHLSPPAKQINTSKKAPSFHAFSCINTCQSQLGNNLIIVVPNMKISKLMETDKLDDPVIYFYTSS